MPLDFFYGDTLKQKCTKQRSTILSISRKKVEQEIKAQKRRDIGKVFDGLVKRFKFCIDVNGDTIEQYR